ncbi:MAG TPA: cytochrome ubiquinol oxidase subunit I [Polyangiaceae bacterium]|nr:cytochrome ubiquinol oxidase subunit I [Polyangiaceae bacterium]
MSDLFAARCQMALSLGFHILFAVAGMAMPLLMVIAEVLYLRTGRAVYYELARRWAKGTAILFAVGAVSGTALSFELGLLWPTFMRHAGPLIGMPFSLEGFAFFLEGIFLGLYLYGWDRLSPKLHVASGVVVALSGLSGGIFVVAVNSWMNTPAGFEAIHLTQADGTPGWQLVELDLWKAFFNPAFPTQATHMALAAYTSVAFAVLGIHAWRLRQHPENEFHRAAVKITFAVALLVTPLQALSGDFAAKHLAEVQPAKLAAAEALFETQSQAPLSLGGWVDADARRLVGAVEIPGLLSVLATGSFEGKVIGLEDIPRDQWPPLNVVHLAFDLMVGCGTLLLAWLGLATFMSVRARAFASFLRQDSALARLLVRSAVWVAPLGLLAVEAGWVVTEVGRQPWIIRGVMRTSEAVTPMPGLIVPLMAFGVLYAFLGVIVIVLLKAHVFAADEKHEPPTKELVSEGGT